MNQSKKHYLTWEEKASVPYTFLGTKIRMHGYYPVDFPIPPQLSLESIRPEERSAVLLYYKHMQNFYGPIGTPEEVCPIYQAPSDFTTYVDQCCEDLAAGNRKPEMDVDHWLYPGFYINNGHVLAAMLIDYPPEFVEFPWPQLLALDMRGYRHDHFPPDVCHLRHLKLLFAGRNQMEVLPPAIGQLSTLRAFTIQETHLTALPDEFCQLRSLIYLNISNVHTEPFHLNSLPARIGDLVLLEYLCLHHNWLTKLPESIGNLHSLKKLDLEFNQLSELPISLLRCQNLLWIALDDNRFTEFSAPLLSLSCAISMSGNHLRSLYGVPQSRYREIRAVLPHRVFGWIRDDQFDAITAYYARPLLDIVESLIHDGTLPEFETERLLHEATPAIRQYLENHLPPTHPIIAALAEHWAVEITNDSDHHQILL